MFKREFDGNLGLLDADTWLADLGYLGLETDYDVTAGSLPHRKPRRSSAQPDTGLSPTSTTPATASTSNTPLPAASA